MNIIRIAVLSCFMTSLWSCRTTDKSFLKEGNDNPLEKPELVALDKKIRAQYNEIDNEPKTRDGLNLRERRALYQSSANNSVARLAMVDHYDPLGLTGFCFGRAITVSLYARKMALGQDSIKKLFVVGDLKANANDKTLWRFHVTTIVTGTDGVEYAIDPIMGGVMTAKEWVETTSRMWDQWYKQVQGVDEPQAKFYMVERDAVLPDIRDFKGADDETGKQIIDSLKTPFNPKGRRGFKKDSSLGFSAYRLTRAASQKYFLSVNERKKSDEYNFIGLVFSDGFFIDYSSTPDQGGKFDRYYVDLLNTFEGGRIVVPNEATVLANRVADAAPQINTRHISFDFEKIRILSKGR